MVTSALILRPVHVIFQGDGTCEIDTLSPVADYKENVTIAAKIKNKIAAKIKNKIHENKGYKTSDPQDNEAFIKIMLEHFKTMHQLTQLCRRRPCTGYEDPVFRQIDYAGAHYRKLQQQQTKRTGRSIIHFIAQVLQVLRYPEECVDVDKTTFVQAVQQKIVDGLATLGVTVTYLDDNTAAATSDTHLQPPPQQQLAFNPHAASGSGWEPQHLLPEAPSPDVLAAQLAALGIAGAAPQTAGYSHGAMQQQILGWQPPVVGYGAALLPQQAPSPDVLAAQLAYFQQQQLALQVAAGQPTLYETPFGQQAVTGHGASGSGWGLSSQHSPDAQATYLQAFSAGMSGTIGAPPTDAPRVVDSTLVQAFSQLSLANKVTALLRMDPELRARYVSHLSDDERQSLMIALEIHNSNLRPQ